ncbi:hypothetical protein S40288_10735 [Stachybotrys chartarum IBT 40288]|nr:hypothetical protein S40288_10735 [Stachybotrys chartarum IBT 40288]
MSFFVEPCGLLSNKDAYDIAWVMPSIYIALDGYSDSQHLAIFDSIPTCQTCQGQLEPGRLRNPQLRGVSPDPSQHVKLHHRPCRRDDPSSSPRRPRHGQRSLPKLCLWGAAPSLPFEDAEGGGVRATIATWFSTSCLGTSAQDICRMAIAFSAKQICTQIRGKWKECEMNGVMKPGKHVFALEWRYSAERSDLGGDWDLLHRICT